MCWRLIAVLTIVSMLSWDSSSYAELHDQHGDHGVHVVKTSSPVNVSISVDNSKSTDQHTAFNIVAITAIDADDFVINVEIPNNAELVSGELTWAGSMEASVQRQIQFVAKLNHQVDQVITVSAQIHISGNPQFSATASYENFAAFASAVKFDSAKSKSRTATRRGRVITEYQVK